MKERTGYKGQRYEVRAMDGKRQFTVGWTNEKDGGDLVEMIKLHPVWNKPLVVDLKKKGKHERHIK